MLRIEISGTYAGNSKEYYPINTLVFKNAGKEIVLDRENTDFTAENGKFQESWRNVYVWDGENEIKDYEDTILDGAHLSEVCLDEDGTPKVHPKEIVAYSLDNPDIEYKFSLGEAA